MDRKLKVGILSLYYNNRNYGGLLQAYALQKYIASYEIECEQICYINIGSYKKDQLERIKKAIRNPQKIVRYFWRLLNVIISYFLGRNIKKRIKAFDAFQEKIPHSDDIYRGEY